MLESYYLRGILGVGRTVLADAPRAVGAHAKEFMVAD
jgi:hypothetical protein